MIYCGDYLDPSHEYFHLDKDELLARFLPALKRVNPAFEPSWVRASWLHREVYAQPIVPVNHSRAIPPLATPLPGLFWASMSQVYPWDRGTNFAVELGQRVAREVAAHAGTAASDRQGEEGTVHGAPTGRATRRLTRYAGASRREIEAFASALRARSAYVLAGELRGRLVSAMPHGELASPWGGAAAGRSMSAWASRCWTESLSVWASALRSARRWPWVTEASM